MRRIVPAFCGMSGWYRATVNGGRAGFMAMGLIGMVDPRGAGRRGRENRRDGVSPFPDYKKSGGEASHLSLSY
jgi:hypothetical protein